MSKSRSSPWKTILTTAFLLAVFTGLLIGWLRTEDLTARWILGIVLIAGLLSFVYSTISDWRQDRRLHRQLAGRESLDPDTFGKRFFSNAANGPEAAAAVRRLLDEHLQEDLGGLRPEDPLDCLGDWLDPLFLDELSGRLGFRPLANWEEFRDFMQPLVTVGDLINAVARVMGMATVQKT